MSETATTPAPPRRLFGLEIAFPLESVWRGDRLLGTIEVRDADVWFRPAGWPWFMPTRTGLRMDALEALERFAGRPGYWPRRNVPAELKITRVAEGVGEE